MEPLPNLRHGPEPALKALWPKPRSALIKQQRSPRAKEAVIKSRYLNTARNARKVFKTVRAFLCDDNCVFYVRVGTKYWRRNDEDNDTTLLLRVLCVLFPFIRPQQKKPLEQECCATPFRQDARARHTFNGEASFWLRLLLRAFYPAASTLKRPRSTEPRRHFCRFMFSCFCLF